MPLGIIARSIIAVLETFDCDIRYNFTLRVPSQGPFRCAGPLGPNYVATWVSRTEC